VLALRKDHPFLKKLQIILMERFSKGFILRTEYRLFMSQRFKFDRTGSKEILYSLVDAGLVKNKNRGIYISSSEING